MSITPPGRRRALNGAADASRPCDEPLRKCGLAGSSGLDRCGLRNTRRGRAAPATMPSVGRGSRPSASGAATSRSRPSTRNAIRRRRRRRQYRTINHDLERARTAASSKLPAALRQVKSAARVGSPLLTELHRRAEPASAEVLINRTESERHAEDDGDERGRVPPKVQPQFRPMTAPGGRAHCGHDCPRPAVPGRSPEDAGRLEWFGARPACVMPSAAGDETRGRRGAAAARRARHEHAGRALVAQPAPRQVDHARRSPAESCRIGSPRISQPVHQRARDRDALQPGRPRAAAAAAPGAGRGRPRPVRRAPAPRRAAAAAAAAARHCGTPEVRQYVEGLEDEAEPAPAQRRGIRLGQRRRLDAVTRHRAAAAVDRVQARR